MKRILLFAIGALSFCSILAQNVGIGTLTPIYRLDLVGRQRIQAGTLNNAGTSPGIWHTDYRSNTNIAFVGMADSVNYGFWGDRAGIGWQFFFDARYGNVGMGRKPSTAYRLSLDDPDGNTLALYGNSSFGGSIRASDTTLNIAAAYGSNACIPNPCPANDIIFWPPPPAFALDFSGRVGMYTNNPNSRVHIAAGTNTAGVLIGGSGSLPAVGYMLAVDGKIICEELKVQLSGSWPDYVFEKDYVMPSLLHLEQKVMSEKHLPGIPSANDVKAQQGIEMGEMQKRLLEKVEELYRYTFELNQKNIKLESKITELETQLREKK